jgi:hypothetical protein
MKWQRVKHLVGIHSWVPHLAFVNGLVYVTQFETCYYCTKTRRYAIR